jgi:predicted DNA-binding transcriptional regulator AlpA
MTNNAQRPGVGTRGAGEGIRVPIECRTDQLTAPGAPDPSPIEPITLDDVLSALRALPPILSRLAAILDRPAVDRLLCRRDLADILGISLPELDRLRAGGRLPRPDLTLGRRSPRWRSETIRAYLERGGRP